MSVGAVIVDWGLSSKPAEEKEVRLKGEMNKLKKTTTISPVVRDSNALTAQWCARLGDQDFALSGAGLWPLLALLASAADEQAGAELAAATGRPAESGQQDALELIEILRAGVSTTAALGLWTRKDIPLHEEWASGLPEVIKRQGLRSGRGHGVQRHMHRGCAVTALPDHRSRSRLRPAVRLHRRVTAEPACGGRGLGQQPVPAGLEAMSQDEIEARKKKAERGWLTDPPPPPPWQYIPREDSKWRLMIGAGYLMRGMSHE